MPVIQEYSYYSYVYAKYLSEREQENASERRDNRKRIQIDWTNKRSRTKSLKKAKN